MPRLSIIVPHQGDTGPFEDTLVSVLQNRPAASEVLVVHPGSYRDPYDLHDEATFIPVAGAPPLTALLNAGVERAAGRVVHVLQNGCEVSDDWATAALAHFDDPAVGCVAPWIVEKADPECLVAMGIGYGWGGKRRLIGAGVAAHKTRHLNRKILGPALQAGFYRTSVLRALGGFDSAVGDELADIDVALSLQAVGYRCRTESECRVSGRSTTSDKRWSFDKGRAAERLFHRHVGTFDGAASWTAHAVQLSGEALAGLVRPQGLIACWAGRSLALFQPFSYRRFRRRLQDIPAPDEGDRAATLRMNGSSQDVHEQDPLARAA